MKKYRLLRIGHCYITRDGNFAVALLRGSKKKGYTFHASSNNSVFIPGRINIQSRIVPNDGHWVEIPPQEFPIVVHLHGEGRSVKLVTA